MNVNRCGLQITQAWSTIQHFTLALSSFESSFVIAVKGELAMFGLIFGTLKQQTSQVHNVLTIPTQGDIMQITMGQAWYWVEYCYLEKNVLMYKKWLDEKIQAMEICVTNWMGEQAPTLVSC